MRVVDRKEFLALPKGTLFIEFERNTIPASEAFMVKGDTPVSMDENGLGDFYELSVSDWQTTNSEEFMDNFFEMKDKGKSFPIEFSWNRNGLFAKDASYLIYEKDDVVALRNLLDQCLDGSIE